METMEAKREETIRLLFSMWVDKKDKGLTKVFMPDGQFIESCQLMYHGADTIARWFSDWNKELTMTEWTIRQFFHKGDQTVVEWHFRFADQDGNGDSAEGLTKIDWAEGTRIARLQEFICPDQRKDPYEK